MSLVPTDTPPIWNAWPVIQLALCVAVLSGPNFTSIAPSMTKETPMAVISGASRGASRRRR